LENLQEIASQVNTYLQASPLNLLIAFVCGFAAVKTTAQERKGGIVSALVVGAMGLFFAEFMIIYFGLIEYVNKLAGFRLLIDVIAAYIGAFVIASALHFIKPL